MNDYSTRLTRTRNAVEMKPVDKIPVSINGPAFVMRAQGLTLKESLTDLDKAVQADIDFLRRVDADSIQTPIMGPEGLATLWLSKVSRPGVELGENELWQVEEVEAVKFEDYDYILKHGYRAFRREVLADRLHVDLDRLAAFQRANPIAVERCTQAGYPVINSGGSVGTPIEPMCGGRSLVNFFEDLMDEPELIKRAFDEIMTVTAEDYTKALDAQPDAFGAWVGGWRAAPELISNETFDEFVWPYLKRLAEITIEHGMVPIFHLDSCWDRAFHYFKELPPHKCILSLDGSSDIRLCRNILGDHSAIMGDVPASLLAFGSASEVYDYTTKLIDDVGPKTGLIVCSGCDIPFNAKYENVKAMVDAAAEYPC